jgi:FkbM family methyltransferase
MANSVTIAVIRTSIVTWIAGWLPRRVHRLQVLRLHRLVRTLRRLYDSYPGPIVTRVHGIRAKLNGGNPYPFLVEEHPLFNRPLVELVRHVAAQVDRRVVVIDVGASLGNTVLLLKEHAADSIVALHCIEADEGFFPLLQENTARYSEVVLHRAMLAREPKLVASLVHHHPGTAAAIGLETVPATTLDLLLLDRLPHCDIIKIDIDGSDGEALLGAGQLLKRDRPAVIFEWHPHLIHQAGNDPRAAFAALDAVGYRCLLWFRNTGHFSHFSNAACSEIKSWERFLLEMQRFGDPHFDIVALPPQLEHLAFTIASLGKLPPPENATMR